MPFININESFINIRKSFININKSLINIRKSSFCPLWSSIVQHVVSHRINEMYKCFPLNF